MHPFVNEFVDRIRDVHDDATLRMFHEWLYSGNPAWAYSRSLNEQLRLPLVNPKFELREDLPCLTVGSRSGLLVLLANPGWDAKQNPVWNRACLAATAGGYHDLLMDFFDTWPRVVQLGSRRRPSYLQFWTRAMSALRLVQADTMPTDTAERWAHAHRSRVLGSWDLFPMMSDKDGLCGHVERRADLHAIAEASARAALRFKPKVLLVASASGAKLVRSILGSDLGRRWAHVRTSKASKARVTGVCSWRTIVTHDERTTTEVICVGTQVFSWAGSYVVDVDILCDELVPRLRVAEVGDVECGRCGWGVDQGGEGDVDH